jgi:TetR/AcrR family transcriptional repressor of nem operon
MARYASEHKSRTRERILAAADRVIKARGAEASSVEAVMREAGLTVGGFYAHFPSKEALARETLLWSLGQHVDRLLESLAPIKDKREWARSLIDRYLAQVEDASLEHACPMTLLLPDLARADPDAKNAFAARTGELLHRIAENFPDVPGMSRREAVLAVYTSCAGAVQVARAVAAPEARQRIVRTTRHMLVRALALED